MGWGWGGGGREGANTPVASLNGYMFWWWWGGGGGVDVVVGFGGVVVVTVVDYSLGNLVACTSVQLKIAAISLRKPLCTAPVSQKFSPHSLRKLPFFMD